MGMENNSNDQGTKSGPGQDLTQQMIKRILGELSLTRYACESLALIPSGTTNFVFRGTLKNAPAAESLDGNTPNSQNQANTVIVKVLEGYARLNPRIKIDGRRGQFESFMFGILNDFEVPKLPITVRTPRLLHVGEAKNTFVIEDFGADCITMAEYLARAKDPDQIRAAEQYMRHLGTWLRAFHEWTLQDGQEGLRETMEGCRESGRFKRDLIYRSMYTWAGDKLKLLDAETMAVFRRVDAMLFHEFQHRNARRCTSEWGPSHGDFWTGNILVPSSHEGAVNPDLSVVDWEFAHLSPRAFDLGQMIGDLVEKYELSRLDVFRGAIDQFVQGYGPVRMGMAFRILVHAGAHLINWYVRGPKDGLSDDEVRRIVKLGVDMVYRGMKEDEQWFRDNNLACILDLATKEEPSIKKE